MQTSPSGDLTGAPPAGQQNKKDGGRQKKKVEKEFIFDRYPSRKIALRLAYHGHVHDGLAKQKETENTVEGHVCDALRRLRLIPEDGPHDFGRCGRTDKGVSALGNAFSFTARASCTADAEPQLAPLDYCNMLNNVLPSTIRTIGFAYVGADFDARFSCVCRTYRYYFCHRGLNVEAMQEAAAHLLGTHNFRNFCKMDVVNVSNFTRTVQSVGVYRSELLPELISYLEITANSFLYHQIRCTMEVLFLVGRGLEQPNVVPALLHRGDRKPVYPLADSTPLVLWDCKFRGLQWKLSHRAFQAAEQELQDVSTALLIRATSAAAMRTQLFRWYAGELSAPGETASTTSDAKRESRTVANERCRDPKWVAPTVTTTATQGNGAGLVVRHSPDYRRQDSWSITGCDWTEPGTQGLLKARRRDLLSYLRAEKNNADPCTLSTLSVVPQPGDGMLVSSSGYVPLLNREVERTYAQEVQELSEKKRARYEVNEAKKVAALNEGDTVQ